MSNPQADTKPIPLEYLVVSGTRPDIAQRINDASREGYLLMSSSTCVYKDEIIATAVLAINRDVFPVRAPSDAAN